MRGNVVVAAAVFAAGLVISSLVLVFGIRWTLNGAAGRLETAISAHGRSVEQAGVNAGGPIKASLEDVAGAFDRHGKAVEQAGKTISLPQIPSDYTIRLQGPVALREPVLIRGPAKDGALPVNAVLGK